MAHNTEAMPANARNAIRKSILIVESRVFNAAGLQFKSIPGLFIAILYDDGCGKVKSPLAAFPFVWRATRAPTTAFSGMIRGASAVER